MKKLEIRPYSLYASMEVMHKRLAEGFEEVAFSFEGDWYKNGQERIPHMCIFFSKDGRVETYEHREIDDLTIIRTVSPYGGICLKEKNIQEYLRQRNIAGLGEKRTITSVLEDAFGWEFR